MFKAGTILELKEPRDPERKIDPQTGEPAFVKRRDPKTGELVNTKEPAFREFAYNRVKVLGPSPIAHEQGEWQGPDAAGVIIQPMTDFDSNLDEPLGKIRHLYNVVEIPEEVVYEPKIRVVEAVTQQAGPTPEEVFAQKAPGQAPKPGQLRGRTRPFDNVKPPAGTHGRSPL